MSIASDNQEAMRDNALTVRLMLVGIIGLYIWCAHLITRIEKLEERIKTIEAGQSP